MGAEKITKLFPAEKKRQTTRGKAKGAAAVRAVEAAQGEKERRESESERCLFCLRKINTLIFPRERDDDDYRKGR